MVIKIKYAVDRVEDNIVVLQDLTTGKIFYENIDLFDEDVHDGDVVLYSNNKYVKSLKDKNDRLAIIKAKMEALRNKEN